MTTARELLRDTDLLLLDFDGPVTKLLPPPSNAVLTDAVRTMALDLGVHLDADEMTTTDHLAIIRAAHRSDTDALISVEREATRLEVEAAKVSPITSGIIEILDLMEQLKKPVVLVTNNSYECAKAFLSKHGLINHIYSIQSRNPEHIEQMKPDPSMLLRAINEIGAKRAVMLGDSISDVSAAQVSNINSIAIAKDDRRAKDLSAHGATKIIHSLVEVLDIDSA